MLQIPVQGEGRSGRFFIFGFLRRISDFLVRSLQRPDQGVEGKEDTMMPALVKRDNTEIFKFFPLRCILKRRSMQHGLQILACFQNILEVFSDGMFANQGRGRLTKHAGTILMV